MRKHIARVLLTLVFLGWRAGGTTDHVDSDIDLPSRSGLTPGPAHHRLTAESSVIEPVLGQTAQVQYDHGDPTALEQYMLEMVNDARSRPAEFAQELGIDLNEGLEPSEWISPEPKPPLAFNPHLIAAARAHSQWMLDNDVFSHTGAGGSSPGDRMQAAGYIFEPPWMWGENIAWEGTTGTPDLPQFVLDEHRALFRSPGHRLNLMEQMFDEIGIGIVQGQFYTQGSDGVWRQYNAVMTTQDFATSAGTPGPFICGVVYLDLDRNGFYTPGEGIAGVKVVPSKGSYYAVTSGSGGYAIPFESGLGTITLRFEIPGYPIPVEKQVVLGTVNVKADLELSSLPVRLYGVKTISGTPDKIHFEICGPFNREVVVEKSLDLLSWKQFKRIYLPKGTATVEEALQVGPTFYRVRVGSN